MSVVTQQNGNRPSAVIARSTNGCCKSMLQVHTAALSPQPHARLQARCLTLDGGSLTFTCSSRTAVFRPSVRPRNEVCWLSVPEALRRPIAPSHGCT